MGIIFQVSFMRLCLSVVFILALLSTECEAQGANYHIMTNKFPPFNYESNGELTGISVEIVRKIMERIGWDNKIYDTPWPRGYAMIEEEPNMVLFSMARTEAREELFRWVGPLVEYPIYLAKRRGSNVQVKSLEDAKKYRVGTKPKVPSHAFLTANGFEKIIVTHENDGKYRNVRMLANGQIDLWITGDLLSQYKSRLAGLPQNITEPVLNLYTETLYIAFSNSTPPSIIRKWQEALDQLVQEGFAEQVKEKYRRLQQDAGGLRIRIVWSGSMAAHARAG